MWTPQHHSKSATHYIIIYIYVLEIIEAEYPHIYDIWQHLGHWSSRYVITYNTISLRNTMINWYMLWSVAQFNIYIYTQHHKAFVARWNHDASAKLVEDFMVEFSTTINDTMILTPYFFGWHNHHSNNCSFCSLCCNLQSVHCWQRLVNVPFSWFGTSPNHSTQDDIYKGPGWCSSGTWIGKLRYYQSTEVQSWIYLQLDGSINQLISIDTSTR